MCRVGVALVKTVAGNVSQTQVTHRPTKNIYLVDLLLQIVKLRRL